MHDVSVISANSPSARATTMRSTLQTRKPRFQMLKLVLRARFATFALCWIALLVLVAIFAPLIAPYDPLRIAPASALQPPSALHWLGTDDLGRDTLSRLMYGARISLLVGFVSMIGALILGSAIGLIAGYRGRAVDETLMRFMDAIAAFPALLLALGITAVLGLGITNVIIALSIVNVPTIARLVRAQVLSVRERDYVLAARSLGFSLPRTLVLHILPSIAPALVVQATIEISHAIIAEASLSFLGVGVRPPTPSWGSMLSTGFTYLGDVPWMWMIPGAAIFITVFSLNMLGDGVRIALDPKNREG